MDYKITTCGICSETFSKSHVPKILLCGHTICSLCIEQLKKKNSNICPFCKTSVSYENPRINYQLIGHEAEIESNQKQIYNQSLNKMLINNYFCSTHVDIKVLNYCITCEEFLCINCSFEHSQSFHVVKYINNKQCHEIRSLQLEVKNNQQEISELIESLPKSFINIEPINSALVKIEKDIDARIESLKKIKDQVQSTKKSLNDSLVKFNKDIDDILNTKLLSLVNNCYFNYSSKATDNLKLVYESIFDYSKLIKLFDNFENMTETNAYTNEINELKSNVVNIKGIIKRNYDKTKTMVNSMIKLNLDSFISKTTSKFDDLEEGVSKLRNLSEEATKVVDLVKINTKTNEIFIAISDEIMSLS